jgi:hypothetical protein
MVILKDMVMSAVAVYVPKIMLGGAEKIRWMNSTVLAKLKTKKEACQRYLQSRSDAGYNRYARAQNQAKESCCTAVKIFEKNIARNAKKEPESLLFVR